MGRDRVETHKSFCRFCHAVCGIEVDIEAGRAIAVRGDKEHVVSQGYLCVKGRALLEQHDAGCIWFSFWTGEPGLYAIEARQTLRGKKQTLMATTILAVE